MNSSISSYLIQSNEEFNERIDGMEIRFNEMLDKLNALTYTVEQVLTMVQSLEGSVSFDIGKAREASYGKYVRR